MLRADLRPTGPARLWSALVLLGAALLLSASPAAAGTFPGQNGRIAYEYLDTVYTIALGDSAGQQLVTHPDGGYEPSWSPRGDRLVFVSVRDGKQDLYVIDADGTDERRLTTNDAIEEINPSWVDDSTVIFRADPDSGEPSFSTVNVNAAPTSAYSLFRLAEPDVVDNFSEPEISSGGELLFTENFQIPGTSKFLSAAWTAIGNGTATRFSGIMPEYSVFSGGWSPDGEEFLYLGRTPVCCSLDVFVDSAGSAPVNLTNTPGRSEDNPRFSPDGTMLVYGDPFGSDNLYVSQADGSGEITLPTGFFGARNPDWQALGGGTPPPAPEPGPPPAPAPPAPADTAAPVLRLSADKRQRSNGVVKVKVACGEPCSIAVRQIGRATIKRDGAKPVKRKLRLRGASAKLGANKARVLKLRFKGRRTKELVRTTLANGKGSVALRLRAVATDGTGNRKVTRIRVKLQR